MRPGVSQLCCVWLDVFMTVSPRNEQAYAVIAAIIADADKYIEYATTQINRLVAERDQRRHEREVLESTLQRMQPGDSLTIRGSAARSVTDDVTVTDWASGKMTRASWQSKKRVDAVAEALGALGTVGPTEIAEFLNERGRDENINGISATLAYLKGKRAWKLRYGKWSATPPENTESPASTGLSVDVPASGLGGDDPHAPTETASDHGDSDGDTNRGHDNGAPVGTLL